MTEDEISLPDLSGLNKKNSADSKKQMSHVGTISEEKEKKIDIKNTGSFEKSLEKENVMPLNKVKLESCDLPENKIKAHVVSNKVLDDTVTIANFLKNPVIPKNLNIEPDNNSKVFDKFASNKETVSSLISIRNKNKNKISIEELKKNITIKEPMNIGQRILKIFK